MGNWDDYFDMDGDPVQSGLYQPDSPGVAFQSGLVIGVCLSVYPADSESNLSRKILIGDGNPDADNRSAGIEASVLAVFSGHDENMVYENCVVLPFGKSSRVGPSEDEPADYSEDIPNGCDAKQLDAFYSGGNTSLNDLNGDWVVLQFVGGMVQHPIVTHWFPNPFNSVDPAIAEDGRRWRLRRNNTDLLIDKNGDFSLAHRAGNFLQMRGKRITLKHVDGAMLSMDESGQADLTDKNGNSINIFDRGVEILNDSAQILIQDSDVQITAPSGDVAVMAANVDIVGSSVTATGGSLSVPKSVLTEAFAAALAIQFTELAAESTKQAAALALLGGGNRAAVAAAAAFTAMAKAYGTAAASMTAVVTIDAGPGNSLKTKNFIAS